MNDGKTALVTGANKGIGHEICRQLREAGFTVILTARDLQKGRQAAMALGCEFLQMDVSDPQSVSAAAGAVKEKYGRLDVLVNNAGIIVNGSDSASARLEDVKKTFDTNFFGAFCVSNVFTPLLKKSKDARIISVSSGMGSILEPGGGYFAYRTSKAALNAMTAIMAIDLAGSVKVNAICPGWVKTDMGGSGAPRNVKQGADTVTWLATEKNIPTGKLFRDRKEINW
jgi:NAD(P)-dependent dehydrogenase (short-subunit alcohol dehydrogenase family)